MCTAFPFAETLSNGKVFGLLTSGVFPHDLHSPGRDTTAQAFGEIFADFSSIAIARDALFERDARV